MALTTFVQNSLPTLEAPTYYPKGVSIGINNVQFPLQVDVPISPIYTFKVIPTAVSAVAVAPAQSFGTGASGGNLTLQTTVVGTAPNIQSQPFTYNGQAGVLLDCERFLRLNFSVPTTTATVVTITGYDYRGVSMIYTSGTFPVGSTTGNTGAPITLVTGVSFSANPFAGNATPTISIGTSALIGLPYALTNTAYVMSASWAGEELSSQTGALINPAFNWRAVEYVGYYTARGHVNLGSDNSPNGSSVLVVIYYVYGADGELSNQIANKNQSSLKIASVQKNTSSSYPTTQFPLNKPVFVYPELLPQDLTGLQLNPDGNFLDGTSVDDKFFINYVNLIAG